MAPRPCPRCWADEVLVPARLGYQIGTLQHRFDEVCIEVVRLHDRAQRVTVASASTRTPRAHASLVGEHVPCRRRWRIARLSVCSGKMAGQAHLSRFRRRPCWHSMRLEVPSSGDPGHALAARLGLRERRPRRSASRLLPLCDLPGRGRADLGRGDEQGHASATTSRALAPGVIHPVAAQIHPAMPRARLLFEGETSELEQPR